MDTILEKLIECKEDLNDIDDIDIFIKQLENVINHRMGGKNYRGVYDIDKLSTNPIVNQFLANCLCTQYATATCSTGMYSRVGDSSMTVTTEGLSFTTNNNDRQRVFDFIKLCLKHNPDDKLLKKILLFLSM